MKMITAFVRTTSLGKRSDIKKFITYMAASSLLAIVLTVCGTTSKMIARESQSERTDVFEAVAGTETISAGYADVIIKANIKRIWKDIISWNQRIFTANQAIPS